MSLVTSGVNAEKPLWGTPPGASKPLSIGFIGVTGEFGSGKSLFGLMVDDQSVCVFDFEDSCKTYESGMGFTRVSSEQQLLAAVGAAKGSIRIDMIELMAKAYPSGAITSRQRFEMFVHLLSKIPIGRWRVALLDTCSEIELGLVEYVKANPGKFGFTPAQFSQSAALMWGAVKDFWKQILGDMTAKFETVVGTTHMRSVFEGGRPTAKREAKGKETIMEMASLYLMLSRDPDAKGKKPERPKAIVLKDRLSYFVRNAEGDLETKAILPPIIENCSPAKIREFIRKPFDYSNAGSDKYLLNQDAMSDDERARIQLATAEAQARAAEANLNLRMAMGQAGAFTPPGSSTAAAAPVSVQVTTPAAVPAESPLKTTNGEQVSQPTAQTSPVVQQVQAGSVQQSAPAPTPAEQKPVVQEQQKPDPSLPSGPGYQTEEEQRVFLLKTIAARKERMGLSDDIWQKALSSNEINAPVDASGVRRANLLPLAGMKILDAWLAKGEARRADAEAAKRAQQQPTQQTKDLTEWASQQVGAAGQPQPAGNAAGNA